MNETFSKDETSILLECYLQAIDVNIITSITDEKGNIIFANKKFCEVSGFSREELIGQNHRIINSGYHSKEFFDDLWKTILKGDMWKGEIRNKAKDGSFYWVDTVIMPVVKENKKQFLSLRMLINERKELEQRKEEYTNSLENMVFLVSHKMRKPLVSILGLMQLNVDKTSKEELKEMIRYYKTSAQELELYTRELTNYLYKLQQKLD